MTIRQKKRKLKATQVSPMVKYFPAKEGDMDSIPGWRRYPGEGNCNPLQYCCLGNPMNRGVWWATVLQVSKESDTVLVVIFLAYFTLYKTDSNEFFLMAE